MTAAKLQRLCSVAAYDKKVDLMGRFYVGTHCKTGQPAGRTARCLRPRALVWGIMAIGVYLTYRILMWPT